MRFVQKQASVSGHAFRHAAKAPTGKRLHALSLQPFNQIKIGKHAVVSEDAGLGIGRHENGTDRFNPSGIRRHQLFPQSALPGLQIEAIDQRGQLARLINIERLAVGTESDRLFSGIESRNRPRLAAGNRKKISFLIGTDPGHPLRVRRNHKRSSVHAFLRDGLTFSRSHVTDV